MKMELLESKSDATSTDSPDFDELTSQYLRVLRIIAIMPLKGRNYNFLITRFLACHCFSVGFVHTSMFLFYGYNRLKQGIIELDYICEMNMIIGYVLRYCIVVDGRHRFWEMHNECRTIWDTCTTEEHRIVHSYVRKIQTAFNGYFIVLMLGGAFYSLTALTTKLPPIRPNGTDTRMLPVRFLTEGMEPSIEYVALFILQVLVIHTCFVMALGMDTASPFIIMFTCGYLRILQDRLFLVGDRQKQKCKSLEMEVYKEIVACSKLHQNILKLCNEIKKFTEWLFLVQILCTGYNLSIIGMKLAGPDPDRYKFISVFGVCLIELLLVQWTPDFLLEESETVATAAYCASSFTMNPRIGKILLIIMQRAKQSVQLTAGGVVNMSIESFGSMLTSAISFFTVLRNLAT